MQDSKSRNPAIEQWLDTIPVPSELEESLNDMSIKNTRPAWVRKDQIKSVFLQGNKFYCKKKEDNNKTRTTSEVTIPKRVTFKTIDDPDQAAPSEEEGGSTDRQGDVKYRLMRRKPDEDRLELARHMNQHLLGVYQRKLTERTQHFVYEPQLGKSTSQDNSKVPMETRQLQFSENTGCLQPSAIASSHLQPSSQASSQLQPGSHASSQQPDTTTSLRHVSKSTPTSPVGEKRRISLKQTRPDRRPSSCRLSDGVKKPVIHGLVVDSASNQKPSIVRASKNANIREEFALQQKIAGYRKSCSQNINTIKIAQRRLSSSWLKLRNKMAQNKMDVKQMEEFRNTTDQLFLRNKGYMPARRESMNHFGFPPLPRRRLLTVH